MCFHDLPALNELGSHALNSQESLADTTGNGALNAAAYELYLLLDCKVENTTLGALLQSGDTDAVSTLGQESAEAEKLAEKLVFLLESKCAKPTVQTLNKQIYWFSGSNPANDNGYCLLVPLYPASLVPSLFANPSYKIWFGKSGCAQGETRRKST